MTCHLCLPSRKLSSVTYIEELNHVTTVNFPPVSLGGAYADTPTTRAHFPTQGQYLGFSMSQPHNNCMMTFRRHGKMFIKSKQEHDCHLCSLACVRAGIMGSSNNNPSFTLSPKMRQDTTAVVIFSPSKIL